MVFFFKHVKWNTAFCIIPQWLDMKYVNNVNVKRIKYNIDLLLCFEGKLKIEPKKKTMPTVVCHALMRCQELSASTSDQVTKKLVPPQTASVIELPPELPPKTKRSRMCILYMYGKHCKVLSYFIQWFFGCLSVCNVMWCFRNFKILKKKISLNMIFNKTYCILDYFCPRVIFILLHLQTLLPLLEFVQRKLS